MKLGRKRIIIGVAVVLVILLIVVGNLRRSSEKGLAVQISKAAKNTITSTVRAPGKITPESKVEITASLPGQIVSLPVREGEWVEQGQLLLQLDKSEYVAQVEQRKAMLGNAKASLRLAESSLQQANPCTRDGRPWLGRILLLPRNWKPQRHNTRSRNRRSRRQGRPLPRRTPH